MDGEHPDQGSYPQRGRNDVPSHVVVKAVTAPGACRTPANQHRPGAMNGTSLSIA